MRILFRLLALLLLALILLFIFINYINKINEETFERKISQAEKLSATCFASPKSFSQCARAESILQGLVSDWDDLENLATKRKLQELLVKVYKTNKKYDSAIKLLVDFAKDDPQKSNYYRELAAVYGLKGDHNVAVRYANLGVQLAPNLWQAHVNNAQVLNNAGYKEEAIIAYEKALVYAPKVNAIEIMNVIDEINISLDSENETLRDE
jgi:tetratricopeptide (TPR) repeat protein